MAEKILYIGETGVGKSRAICKLDPKETILLKAIKKRLPSKIEKEYVLGKNMFLIESNAELAKILKKLKEAKDLKGMKNIVIDDWSFLSAKELMARTKELGFQKFSEVAENIVKVLTAADNLQDELTVVFLSHTKVDENGDQILKTNSRFIEEKWGVVEQFEIVLLGNRDYSITTNGFPAKTPEGMFENTEIDNDMQMILDRIKEYYE